MGEAFYISLLVPLPMTLLARWGGEEFVVLLPHTPLEYARQLAERMRIAVAFATQPYAPMDAVHVTVSIGTAGMAADESMILDDLVQAADLAMYVAKRSGCNQVSLAPTGYSSPHALGHCNRPSGPTTTGWWHRPTPARRKWPSCRRGQRTTIRLPEPAGTLKN